MPGYLQRGIVCAGGTIAVSKFSFMRKDGFWKIKDKLNSELKEGIRITLVNCMQLLALSLLDIGAIATRLRIKSTRGGLEGRNEREEAKEKETVNRGYERQDCSDLADTDVLHNTPIISDRHLTHAA